LLSRCSNAITYSLSSSLENLEINDLSDLKLYGQLDLFFRDAAHNITNTFEVRLSDSDGNHLSFND